MSWVETVADQRCWIVKAMCWCDCPEGECLGESNNNVPSCYDQASKIIDVMRSTSAKTEDG